MAGSGRSGDLVTSSSEAFCRDYARRMQDAFAAGPIDAIGQLASALLNALQQESHVFIAGNGGSAANAMHLANDFLYGIGKDFGVGLRVEALPANASIVTCLANDMSYDEVFAEQIRLKGRADDLLLVLSGSGNSPNIVRAIEAAHARKMKTFAVLGFSGGRCRGSVQCPIHFAVDDMQISEDLQLMVGHMCMQWIRAQLAEQGGPGA